MSCCVKLVQEEASDTAVYSSTAATKFSMCTHSSTQLWKDEEAMIHVPGSSTAVLNNLVVVILVLHVLNLVPVHRCF